MINDLAVYVLVRNDLPSLTAGKAMAQVHHAGVQMMSKYFDNKVDVREYVDIGILHGADHFNTTIVLGASKTEIRKIYQDFRNLLEFGICGEELEY